MRGHGFGVGLVLLTLLSSTISASAEMVLVAPGISVSKRAYAAPLNEMPFFGFQAKTPQQLEADRAFIAQIDVDRGREAGFRRALQLAEQALTTNDLALAARRYNQAYLLMPAAPEVYHGFAIIAFGRFRDSAFAQELYATALRLKPNDEAVLADYGRLLMIEGKPERALPMFEVVVRHPDAKAMHWSNLGFAYAQTGQQSKACEALAAARGKSPPEGLLSDLAILARTAGC